MSLLPLKEKHWQKWDLRQRCRSCEIINFPWLWHTFSSGFTAIFPPCLKRFVYVSTYLWTPNDPHPSFHSSLCYFPQHGREQSDERRGEGKQMKGGQACPQSFSSALFFISFHVPTLQRDLAIKESNHEGTYYFLPPWMHYIMAQAHTASPPSRIHNYSHPEFIIWLWLT